MGLGGNISRWELFRTPLYPLFLVIITSPNAAVCTEYYADEPGYSSCSKTTWNADGSRLFFEEHNIPIMILTNATEVEDLFEDVSAQNYLFSLHYTQLLVIGYDHV